MVPATAVAQRRQTYHQKDQDDDNELEDVSAGASRGGTKYFALDDDEDVEVEEERHGYQLPRTRIAATPPWRQYVKPPVFLTPRRDPDMGVRAGSLFDELTASFANPTITLHPGRAHRTTIALEGAESPLERLMKRVVSTVAPQKLDRIEQHATGRPLAITKEEGTMLAASSQRFINYPIAAAAFTPRHPLGGVFVFKQ